MSRKYAVDTSNWTGEIPVANARCMREKGFDGAIVNLFNGPLARQQYDSYVEAGFSWVDGYIYFNFDEDGVTQLREQLSHLNGRVIRKLWIDCEDEYASNLTEAETVRYIWNIADACKGVVNTGIYTRRGWWLHQTGNDKSFSANGFPLWDATNDGTDNMSLDPYGGWQRSYMEQYRFDVVLCGETVDLNVYEDYEADPTAPELELSYLGYFDDRHNYHLGIEIEGI